MENLEPQGVSDDSPSWAADGGALHADGAHKTDVRGFVLLERAKTSFHDGTTSPFFEQPIKIPSG